MGGKNEYNSNVISLHIERLQIIEKILFALFFSHIFFLVTYERGNHKFCIEYRQQYSGINAVLFNNWKLYFNKTIQTEIFFSLVLLSSM